MPLHMCHPKRDDWGTTKGSSMSHDSGFRRNDHDSTHQPPNPQRRGSKASQAYEERLRRRHSDSEQTRRDTGKTDRP